jgi:signal transduction histidine kinase
MSVSRGELESDCLQVLEEHLTGGGENTLLAAYDLGRKALAAGLGVLDVSTALHRALSACCARAGDHPENLRRIQAAEGFLIEALSPFEMAHRSVRDANDTLHRLNELLEDEIRRLARELHDTSGQLLVSAYLALDEVAREMGSHGQTRIQTVRGRLDEIQEQMRRFCHELRPTILEDLGVGPALRFLAGRMATQTGIGIVIECSLEERPSPRVETALYRIVQEALTNVAKHARATRAIVRLEESDGRIRCTVEDDGIGFDPAVSGTTGARGGLGLVGIRERLSPLSGELLVESAPGGGARLVVTLPVENALVPSARR